MTTNEKKEFSKSNYVYKKEPYPDNLRYIEMQLNKKESLLEKAKLVCVKIDKIFVVVPYTISKIEIRMRNLIINNRDLLEGISHFM